MPERLAKHELVQAAWESVNASKVWDMHVHLVGNGDSGSGEGMHVIRMPEHYGELSPLLHVVPLQLLAYHTACARGTDVDKPSNLSKSVTVE